MVFQSRALDADISVQQNLTYHAALHGIGRKQPIWRSARVLDLVAMTDRRRDRVNTLSGGQMRRVEIAAPCCIAQSSCCSMNRRWASISNRVPTFSGTFGGS